MGTITKAKTKSTKNNTISKMEKSANKKKFILKYWMDERINYKAENENYIIERNTKKMTNMGSLYGTNGFYIDITPKKTYKILSNNNGYDFKGLKNHFIYYQEYCNGMGAIEIETNSPDSIIPHKVKNGLIQSVIDKASFVTCAIQHIFSESRHVTTANTLSRISIFFSYIFCLHQCAKHQIPIDFIKS